MVDSVDDVLLISRNR